ncbi:MAG: hypothetical protein FJ278_21810, partial [Planctomycetes bacterium]|nr:hypothetical protein [Planctomycetota bacterium]
MSPTKVALIGCGHPHSTGHLTTFKIMLEVAAIHLCDPDTAAAEKLRQAAPDRVEAVHGSLDALLAREDVKAVAICLPNDETPAAIVAAARAG